MLAAGVKRLLDDAHHDQKVVLTEAAWADELNGGRGIGKRCGIVCDEKA